MTTDDQLSPSSSGGTGASAAPTGATVARDPWAARDARDDSTTATEIIAAPGKTEETGTPGTALVARSAGTPGGGPLPPAGPPPGGWGTPPSAARRPRFPRSPKVVLIAAVLVTAIASSGITAAVMSAVNPGSAPAAVTQDGTAQDGTAQNGTAQNGTVPQGGPGRRFGNGPRGGVQDGDGSGGTRQDSSETEEGAQDTTGTGT